MESRSQPDPGRARLEAVIRALRQHRSRLARRLEALRKDLAEAERAPEFRRYAEALAAYLNQVPAHVARVELPDPAAPGRTLGITLDPTLRPHTNAERYFKRAAKAERGLGIIPPRIDQAEAELRSVALLLERWKHAGERASQVAARSNPLPDPTLEREAEEAFARLPPVAQRRAFAALPPGVLGRSGRRGKLALPARLRPRRFKSREGWEVLIGRSNEGNDYLTHRLARPEDYWFHVHGASGSHVILRRGKGKNEPSRQTFQEIASWAAFFSRARTSGKVAVLVTRKKYVRKPRKSPPGLAVCERERTLIVRPTEPAPDTLMEESSQD